MKKQMLTFLFQVRTHLKINERRRDKAKTGEKAQCTRQYMSILSPFSTPYRQAQ
jgi:hypothetical protein